MNPMDTQAAVDFWERLGLQPTAYEAGRQVWKDVCVVEHAFGGPTQPGDWLEFDSERRCVYLKGEAPEPVVGREEYQEPGVSVGSPDATRSATRTPLPRGLPRGK